MNDSSPFSLEQFETLVRDRQYDEAIDLLEQFRRTTFDRPFPDLSTLIERPFGQPWLKADRLRERFLIRIAATLTSLLSDEQFVLTDERMAVLLNMRSFIWSIFSAAPLRSADHVLHKFVHRSGDGSSSGTLSPEAVRRLSILCTPESRLNLDYRALWQEDPLAAVNLCIAPAAALLPGSMAAYEQRDHLLAWLTDKLGDVDDISKLNINEVAGLYMHCSYAGTPDQHAVKRAINNLARRKLSESGLTDLDTSHPSDRLASGKRPVMMVLAERFVSGHSIMRTHSRTIAAAREKFDTVLLSVSDYVDDFGKSMCDRVVDIGSLTAPSEAIQRIREFAQAERPEVLYMPSVGMSPLTIFLSNVRVAPLQIAALGHPATTHSDKIDFISAEADYVGDPACFSEKLMLLPKDGQPYRPSQLLEPIVPRPPKARPQVDIAVAASLMKLNPRFLSACGTILERIGIDGRIHFLSNGGTIFDLVHLEKVVSQYVPSGRFRIHGHRPYSEYIRALNDMDMFLSPFPFGNTNGIVDAFTVGLPGVCKTGPEVFEHIDGAMFMRAGMPGWLVADTVEEYIDAAVRLATHHEERVSLRKFMIEANIVDRFFQGRPEVFGEMVLELVREQQAAATQ
jgi:hypothetical protein